MNPTLFQFHNKEIRTFTDEAGEPWFVAVDVCRALEIGDASQACLRLDDSERMTLTPNPYNTGIGSHGGKAPIIVSESGLWALVFQSRKPEAEKFRRWVTSDVLPALRKTGSYQMPALSQDEYTIALANQALALIAEKQKMQAVIEAQKPDVEFAQAIKTSEKSISINEAAKAIGPPCGQNNLYRFLREQGLLISCGDDYNLPLQRFVNQKLFEIDVKPHWEGEKRVIGRKTKVTGKGLAYITALWNERALPYYSDSYPKK